MVRLSKLQPAIGALASPVERLAPQVDASRKERHAWRAWYGTAAWQRLRWSVLVAARFTCVRCGQVMSDTAMLVADHKVAHRGDRALFWDRANLQCMCKPCHDGAKQREETAARGLGI
ncbi:HNH endonuclease [Oceaniglobus trochenteri]|uniref:HNH endonuclease n=1 Tax=Oceaniglobus trochenteri TaxID=2763260 RepID=UPI001CFFF363|nr:HNH endonuclease signature motif containing protein [Oceaniglobus trochenteri]